MKSLLSLAGCILALAASNVASAVPISGNIDFNGGAVLDSTSLVSATTVNSFQNVAVFDGTDTFASVGPSTSVTFTSPWVFGSGKSNLWSILLNGFTYSFNLTNSSIVTQTTGILYVTGKGTIVSTDPSATSAIATWSFSINSASGGSQNAKFSFSSSSGTVPDGGTTALLLGAALVGVGLLARQRKQVA